MRTPCSISVFPHMASVCEQVDALSPGQEGKGFPLCVASGGASARELRSVRSSFGAPSVKIFHLTLW
jgi:hypothetical protein